MGQPFGVTASTAPRAGGCAAAPLLQATRCASRALAVFSTGLSCWSRRLCSKVNPGQSQIAHGVPRRLPATSSATAGRLQLW